MEKIETFEKKNLYKISKCPYCHNKDKFSKTPLVDDDGYAQVYIVDQHLRLLHTTGMASSKIYFCPMCGREL
jgi:hypothetical protein